MGLNNTIGNAEAKSGPVILVLGGEKRVKDLIDNGFRYAWAGIGKLYNYIILISRVFDNIG
jgi:hypothetical protein